MSTQNGLLSPAHTMGLDLHWSLLFTNTSKVRIPGDALPVVFFLPAAESLMAASPRSHRHRLPVNL